MNNPSTSPFRKMQDLYNRFLYLQAGPGILAFLLVQFGVLKPFATVSFDRLLQVIAVIYSFAAVIVGLQLFRRRVEAARDSQEAPREKLAKYRSAALMQWSLLEVAGLFSTVCYVITGNWAFLGLALTILVIFGGLNPFKQKVMIQLRLGEQDIAGL